jgi:hypothetical protein
MNSHWGKPLFTPRVFELPNDHGGSTPPLPPVGVARHAEPVEMFASSVPSTWTTPPITCLRRCLIAPTCSSFKAHSTIGAKYHRRLRVQTCRSMESYAGRSVSTKAEYPAYDEADPLVERLNQGQARFRRDSGGLSSIPIDTTDTACWRAADRRRTVTLRPRAEPAPVRTPGAAFTQDRSARTMTDKTGSPSSPAHHSRTHHTPAAADPRWRRPGQAQQFLVAGSAQPPAPARPRPGVQSLRCGLRLREGLREP